MVLRQSPVPLNMLFQQMKSMRSFNIEEPDTKSTPSIAVANNDITPNESATVRSRLKQSLGVHSPTHEDSNCYLLSVSLSKRSSTVWSNFTERLYESLNDTLVNYNLKNHSQRTRFIFGRNSNITSLDELWYTYSYIYKPTSTSIQYGFNSPTTGPFRLSAILKHTLTPFLPTPLFATSSFTTRIALQLSAILKAASASSLPLLSWTLFVNFFLWSAVDPDTDFHLLDQGSVCYL